MLNGNGNENGTKINRSNQQKKKKKKFARAGHFLNTPFCLSPLLFCTTTMPFCTTKTSNFLVTHYFYGEMEELSYVLTKDFVSCVHFRFYSFNAAYFHLVASISHVLTAAVKFSCFSSHEKSSFPQLFLCYPREYKHQK